MSLKPFAMFLVLLVLGAAGCMSGSAPAPSSSAPTRAVLVTTQSGQSTILVPAGDKVSVMAEKEDTTCAACKAAAATYFSGGTLPEKCPGCGASLHAMTGHQ